MPYATINLGDKIEVVLLGQVSEIANQICDGVLFNGVAALLKNRERLSGRGNVFGFIDHVSLDCTIRLGDVFANSIFSGKTTARVAQNRIGWGSCTALSANDAEQPVDQKKDGDKPETGKSEVWKLACDRGTEEKHRKIRAAGNNHSQERVIFHDGLPSWRRCCSKFNLAKSHNPLAGYGANRGGNFGQGG